MNRPDFLTCVEMLRSNDGQTYENGYQWLQGYLVDHIEDLLSLMNEESEPIVRSKFVELVGDSKNPKVIPDLERELKSQYREVRMWAYSSLEYFDHPDATAIAASFRSQNPDEDFL